MKRRYVAPLRKAPPILPHDTWVGGVFKEADGTELLVMWNGDKNAPALTAALPRGNAHWQKVGHPVASIV